ncbi:MAG: M20/M25/M40 family metallo-hydrolase [Anaerolineae bacterium]|nr:M20/M25/M40 family metallo-hydrolase [Anaerolineae bacterium]
MNDSKDFLRRCSSRLLQIVLPVLLAGSALTIFWIGIVLAQAPADLPEVVGYNPLVADIIAQITTPTLRYELEGLTGERPVTVVGISYTIATRNSEWSQVALSMTTRYAYEQLAATGLSVTYHNYTYGSYHWRNVVAEKPGLVDPDEVYLITAHIDDLPKGADAPGADDNGSGSVAVLMAARLLADRHFAYTVRFVLFTGEEQGLLGSAAYAAGCFARGDDIRGVVNLDMIAYNSDALRAIDLHTSSSVPESLEVAGVFSDVIGIYGLSLVPSHFVDSWAITRSDQWSFLARGYPAFLAIEDYDDFTPYYHHSSDALSTLDLDYYADFTRAALAAVAHLAHIIPSGVLYGAVTNLEAGQPLSGAVIAASCSTYVYTFTAPTDASGVYTLSLPVGAYTLIVEMEPLPYYSTIVTDVIVVTDTVTMQNVTLTPWPRQYFPLVTYDG